MSKARYTEAEKCQILALRFRDKPRPAPWQAIAKNLGVVVGDMSIERVLWGAYTGYPTDNDAAGIPRDALTWPRGREHCRAGDKWRKPEIEALHAALAGEGQRRNPPLDVAYIAQVLARTEDEVACQWAREKEDPLRRTGFF